MHLLKLLWLTIFTLYGTIALAEGEKLAGLVIYNATHSLSVVNLEEAETNRELVDILKTANMACSVGMYVSMNTKTITEGRICIYYFQLFHFMTPEFVGVSPNFTKNQNIFTYNTFLDIYKYSFPLLILDKYGNILHIFSKTHIFCKTFQRCETTKLISSKKLDKKIHSIKFKSICKHFYAKIFIFVVLFAHIFRKYFGHFSY